MEPARAQGPLRLGLQAGPHPRVRAREVDDVQQGALVEPRPARDDRHSPARVDPLHVGAGVALVGGHGRLVAHVEHVDLVVGDAAALLHGSLRGADVHAPVELQRVRGDQFPRPPGPEARGGALRDGERHVGLARGGGADDGDDEVAGARIGLVHGSSVWARATAGRPRADRLGA